ncbi:hypothetical protein Pyrde_0305 [Pyrodictium delaneyi]|uniref:Uncharacterized protein n=1 Tax=Pyrodictium delaneyi TaxID=1273541 RepID=A0A0P0N143_9CREN|nr:hypothetical protein [Pyrodictium delaneyi]ALL00355.1 hypothetical protein Pyrde_0305 [Pyrodictium delaneyi]OWJ54411.1 hypothetical protein Pdsh_08055 [Pyrodictium delaneyi]
MTYIVELFPPGFMGRGFQLLALSIEPTLVAGIEKDRAIFGSKEEFIALIQVAGERALSLLRDKLIQPPRMFGNDHKPIQKILGRTISKDERRWDIAVKLVVDGILSDSVSLDNPRIVPMGLMKLNIFEKARTMRGGIKPGSKSLLKEMTPAAFTLALVGGLLSKIGRVGSRGLYILPVPEAGTYDLDNIGLLYSLLVYTASDSQLAPLGKLLVSGGAEKLPVSLDVLLLLYGSAFIAELLEEQVDETCMKVGGVDSKLNMLLIASVTESGNRAILNQLLPLLFSEILCKLGSKPLAILAPLLWRSVSTGVCGSDPDPGRKAVAHCVSKLFLYTLTDNDVYLYDCVRLLRGISDSRQCIGQKGVLDYAARVLSEYYARLRYTLTP